MSRSISGSRAAARVRPLTPEQKAEERKLWADYYEATTRALEIMRVGGFGPECLPELLVQHSLARRALARIKEIHAIT